MHLHTVFGVHSAIKLESGLCSSLLLQLLVNIGDDSNGLILPGKLITAEGVVPELGGIIAK